jgi:hypothetical protein
LIVVTADGRSSKSRWRKREIARDQGIEREHGTARSYLYANPVAASFGATLHKQVVTTLQLRRHEIDDLTSMPNPSIQ